MTSSQNQPLVENNSSDNMMLSILEHLPFAFARRHGVMVNQSDEQTVSLICRQSFSPAVLLEVQRYFHKSVITKIVEDEDFDSLLQQSYETQTQQTNMEEFDGELDLSGVAEALPEPEDLLEAEDDAPIIRLINVLLARAVKQNASDIHIEPFENRLVIRIRVDGILQVL